MAEAASDVTPAAQTSDSPTSVVPSSTTASSSASPSGVDLTRLFGPGERPDIRHLEQVATVVNGGNEQTLEMISMALLALTKLQSECMWIKSMFDLPGQVGSVHEGPDVVNITLFQPDGKPLDNRDGSKKSMKITKGRLTRLSALGVEADRITEPWWPFALIEAVLEAKNAILKDAEVDGESYARLLLTLTGELNASPVVRSGLNEQDEPESVLAILEEADFSPVIYEQAKGLWAVLMRAPYQDSQGVKWIEWARPFSSFFNNHTIDFNTPSRLEYFDTKKVALAHMDPPTGSNGRPDTLTL